MEITKAKSRKILPTNPLLLYDAYEFLSGKRQRIRLLFEEGTFPEFGWEQMEIERLLMSLSSLDSNNLGSVGAGEREGRVFSSIVSRRNFGLAHGIGRSGTVNAIQPKAAGSSLILQTAKRALQKFLRRTLGFSNLSDLLILPSATGVCLLFTLLHLKALCSKRANKILLSRIDQKTVKKVVLSSNLECIELPLDKFDEYLQLNPKTVEESLKSHGDEVVAVVVVTSCFAPRVPDPVIEIAKLCNKYNKPLVINNAYGLQCTRICHEVNLALVECEDVVVVQSTDKNFMVPVGGGIIFSNKKELVEGINKTYPGRASMSPVLDLFVTFLEMGTQGYVNIRKSRKALIPYLVHSLESVVEKYDQRLLKSSKNTISFAVSLDFPNVPVKEFGSMLWKRGVSGARVVVDGEYGSSYNSYGLNYFTIACAIGMSKEDIDELMKKLTKTFSDFFKRFKIRTE
eukprot:snap_masked-scaffold_21-processed-gene-5.83-mRNA-1 protein AED:0.02 eAED:0.02 QI:0/-1/0/1/-1/1/1/0/456